MVQPSLDMENRELPTWADFKQTIQNGNFDAFCRHPLVEKRYKVMQRWISADYGSMQEFLWGFRLAEAIIRLEPSTITDSPYNQLSFNSPRVQYKIVENDWPYIVPPGIRHMLVWTVLPIVAQYGVAPLTLEHGACGFTGCNPQEQLQKRGAHHADRISKFVGAEWSEELFETAWFVTPETLASKELLSVIHVFVRAKRPEIWQTKSDLEWEASEVRRKLEQAGRDARGKRKKKSTKKNKKKGKGQAEEDDEEEEEEEDDEDDEDDHVLVIRPANNLLEIIDPNDPDEEDEDAWTDDDEDEEEDEVIFVPRKPAQSVNGIEVNRVPARAAPRHTTSVGTDPSSSRHSIRGGGAEVVELDGTPSPGSERNPISIPSSSGASPKGPNIMQQHAAGAARSVERDRSRLSEDSDEVVEVAPPLQDDNGEQGQQQSVEERATFEEREASVPPAVAERLRSGVPYSYGARTSHDVPHATTSRYIPHPQNQDQSPVRGDEAVAPPRSVDRPAAHGPPQPPASGPPQHFWSLVAQTPSYLEGVPTPSASGHGHNRQYAIPRSSDDGRPHTSAGEYNTASPHASASAQPPAQQQLSSTAASHVSTPAQPPAQQQLSSSTDFAMRRRGAIAVPSFGSAEYSRAGPSYGTSQSIAGQPPRAQEYATSVPVASSSQPAQDLNRGGNRSGDRYGDGAQPGAENQLEARQRQRTPREYDVGRQAAPSTEIGTREGYTPRYSYPDRGRTQAQPPLASMADEDDEIGWTSEARARMQARRAGHIAAVYQSARRRGWDEQYAGRSQSQQTNSQQTSLPGEQTRSGYPQVAAGVPRYGYDRANANVAHPITQPATTIQSEQNARPSQQRRVPYHQATNRQAQPPSLTAAQALSIGTEQGSERPRVNAENARGFDYGNGAQYDGPQARRALPTLPQVSAETRRDMTQASHPEPAYYYPTGGMPGRVPYSQDRGINLSQSQGPTRPPAQYPPTNRRRTFSDGSDFPPPSRHIDEDYDA